MGGMVETAVNPTRGVVATLTVTLTLTCWVQLPSEPDSELDEKG